MSEAQLTPEDRINPPPVAAEESRSTALEAFFSGFFQEKNIRWMLIIGAAIVFGSSLMLVTRVWSTFDHTLKYLTVFGYTAGIFGVAEFCRRRLHLELTWKVLHSLTLLLLPICLQWLSFAGPEAGGFWQSLEIVGLMIPTAVFLWFASSMILDNLLRGRQTTYLISYQLLCFAGAIPAFSSGNTLTAFVFMSVCWFVMTAGVLKVNRHVFWINEDHRSPRVFGFLPVALLAAQFLILMITKTVAFGGLPQSVIPVHWLGLGLTLVAATVLLTARSIAAVWRQRTLAEEETMPWTIIVPTLVGVMTASVGVILSLSGFHFVGPTTLAVVPTAAVAAVLMLMMARDMRHQVFVWIALLFVTIAYQCSPVLFSDIVRMVKEGVETAIHEQRLPVAFYGLTYLPLIAVATGAWRYLASRSEEELARPFKHFATIVSLGLFAASATHIKALFFVSSVNIATFLVLGAMFRDRRYVLPAIGALVLAVGSAIPACNGMELTQISVDYSATALAALAVLLTATRVPDRLANLIPANRSLFRHVSAESGHVTTTSLALKHADGSDRGLFQLAGCWLAGIMGLHWAVVGVLQHDVALSIAETLQFAFLMTGLAVYSVRQPHYLTGLTLWTLAGLAGLRWATGVHFEIDQIAQGSTIGLAGFWTLAWLLLRVISVLPQTSGTIRRSLGVDASSGLVPVNPENVRAFRIRMAGLLLPLADVCLMGLFVAGVVFHLPAIIRANLMLFGTHTIDVGVSTAVWALWLTGAAWMLRHGTTAVSGIIILPLWATGTLISEGVVTSWQSALCIWSLLIVPIHLGACRFGNRQMSSVCAVGLVVLAFASCVALDPALRVCGAITLAGLFGGSLLSAPKKHPDEGRTQITWYAILGTIHGILLTAVLAGATGFILSPQDPMIICAVLPGTAVCQALFNHLSPRLVPDAARVWSRFLSGLMGLLYLIAVAGSTQYPPVLLVGMTSGLVVAGAFRIRSAVRLQEQSSVWHAVGLSVAALCFLFDQGVIRFGDGWCQVICLSGASLLLMLVHATRNSAQLAVLHRPFILLGQLLPLYTIIRLPFAGEAGSELLSSGCLLIACVLYVQQTIATGKGRFGVAAAVTGNLGLIMMWRLLDVTDPGFYLVPAGLTVLAFTELLKKQIPQSAHEPLRYIGALMILMSPVTQLMNDGWVPALTLLATSVILILLAIGLKLRALVYAGSAALAVALLTMVLKSRVDYPFVPWLCGIGLGMAVIGIAAFCENHREKVLSRIRFVSAELATWK